LRNPPIAPGPAPGAILRDGSVYARFNQWPCWSCEIVALWGIGYPQLQRRAPSILIARERGGFRGRAGSGSRPWSRWNAVAGSQNRRTTRAPSASARAVIFSDFLKGTAKVETPREQKKFPEPGSAPAPRAPCGDSTQQRDAKETDSSTVTSLICRSEEAVCEFTFA